MAGKNNLSALETEEKTTEVQTSEIPALIPKVKAAAKPTVPDYQKFVYIGPTLPGSRLKSNTIIQGSLEKIKDYYKDVLEDFPQVLHLIIPIHKLGEAKTKVETKGNILNKYYNDIVSVASGKKEE